LKVNNYKNTTDELVVVPLPGFDCPVLAWGLGLDRVVAFPSYTRKSLNDNENLKFSLS